MRILRRCFRLYRRALEGGVSFSLLFAKVFCKKPLPILQLRRLSPVGTGIGSQEARQAGGECTISAKETGQNITLLRRAVPLHKLHAPLENETQPSSLQVNETPWGNMRTSQDKLVKQERQNDTIQCSTCVRYAHRRNDDQKLAPSALLHNWTGIAYDSLLHMTTQHKTCNSGHELK